MDRTAKIIAVSTHSRPKAAGALDDFVNAGTYVSTHSRPKAAGDERDVEALSTLMFQLTAARRRLDTARERGTPIDSFNSQPPEGGWMMSDKYLLKAMMFQLTAARRRLADLYNSRNTSSAGFNSQPPEGGWVFM